MDSEEIEEIDSEEIEEIEEEIDWLSISKDAYETSNTFYNSSINTQIKKNIDFFNSRHQSGSKYHTESYKYRSKIFRPKTRSSIRRHEAAASVAFFSTSEVVNCSAVNQTDHAAVLGAMVAKNLINTRLQEPSTMWFQTCLGAYQDAMVQGVVISRQEWIYAENGDSIDSDEFRSTLVPVENFRFDPNADWRDPIADSPYLIELIPMYVGDVNEKMENGEWIQLEEGALHNGNNTEDHSQTRRSRAPDRQDAKDIDYQTSEYDVVWIHRNIINQEGQDFVYYTLGTTELLSEPVPLLEEFPYGRPYVIGFSNLETHKAFPAAPVELLSTIQQEANEIANQRIDNVKLAVNRQTIVRRSAKLDLAGLTTSAPGKITLVDDITKDIRHDAPPDVTGSAYAEQDRLNNDFDELAGSFSGSSVASNRAMNETVGGMELMSQDANSVTDYQLRTFTETWMKPVLRQILAMERIYETDPVRLSSASGGIKTDVVIQALQSDVLLTLSVGFGATNPQKQVEKLSFALNTIGRYLPNMIAKLNPEAIMSEVFGTLGYQDGSRFFDMENTENPEVDQLKQQVQQLAQELKTKQLESQTKIQVEQVKQQGNMQREEIRNQTNKDIAQLDAKIAFIKQQIAAEKNDIARGQLVVQEEAFEFSKKEKELESVLNERNRMSEILMNGDYGLAPGVEDKAGRG